MSNSAALNTALITRMPSYENHTALTTKRSGVRVATVPASLLPLSGLTILVGITIAILRLIIIG